MKWAQAKEFARLFSSQIWRSHCCSTNLIRPLYAVFHSFLHYTVIHSLKPPKRSMQPCWEQGVGLMVLHSRDERERDMSPKRTWNIGRRTDAKLAVWLWVNHLTSLCSRILQIRRNNSCCPGLIALLQEKWCSLAIQSSTDGKAIDVKTLTVREGKFKAHRNTHCTGKRPILFW